jgi:hypothetical protein
MGSALKKTVTERRKIGYGNKKQWANFLLKITIKNLEGYKDYFLRFCVFHLKVRRRGGRRGFFTLSDLIWPWFGYYI